MAHDLNAPAFWAAVTPFTLLEITSAFWAIVVGFLTSLLIERREMAAYWQEKGPLGNR